MNLEQLEQKHKELGAEIERLKQEGEWKGHPDIFTPKWREHFYVVKQLEDTGDFKSLTFLSDLDTPTTKNVFRNEKAANALAERLNIEMELKACEGARKFIVGRGNFSLGYNCLAKSLFVQSWLEWASSPFAVWFDTTKQAQAARKKVGGERIAAVFESLIDRGE